MDIDDPAIRTLYDRIKIQELTARYNRCFDEGDAAGFAATFTEDGVMEVEGGFSARGYDELTALCKKASGPIRHLTTDAVIHIDHDTATQVVTLLVVNRPGGGRKPGIAQVGVYRDHLLRTPHGWLFTRRRATLDGGLPARGQIPGANGARLDTTSGDAAATEQEIAAALSTDAASGTTSLPRTEEVRFEP